MTDLETEGVRAASSLASYGDLAVRSATWKDSNSSAPRIPQLAVRNKSLESGSGESRPSTYASSGSGSSTPSSSQSLRTLAPRDARDEQWGHPGITMPGRRSPNLQSTAGDTIQTKKKKAGGMLGFLTLKEPSTSALAEFAEAEKSKAKQKGSRASPVGLPGVSSQRLPEHVPKVNSKWDGLPESAKRQSMSSRGTDHHKRDSVFSSATRPSVWTANSSASGNSRDGRRPFAPSDFDRLRGPARPSSSTQPPALALETTSIVDMVENTDDNKPQTFLYPPSPLDQRQNNIPELSASPPLQELEDPDSVPLHELDALSSRTSSPDVYSPLTPPVEGDRASPMLVGVHYPELASPTQIAAVDRNSTFFNSDTENEDSQAKIYRAPTRSPTVNFSRPRLNKPVPLHIPEDPISPISPVGNSRWEIPGSGNSLLSPTLKNSRGQINPFLTDTLAAKSRETGRVPSRNSSVQRNLSPPASPWAADRPASTPPVAMRQASDDSQRPASKDTMESDKSSSGSSCTSEGSKTKQPQQPLERSRSFDSIAESLAPSIASERWNLTSKERLGLGSRIRKSDVLPWEENEDLADNENEDFALPSPSLFGGGRKRLSFRLNSRR